MSISPELGAIRQVQLAEGPIEYRERGSGAPIVFLHGIVANGDVWRHVVADLGDRYRCIAPDWPLGGHRLPMRSGTDFSLFGLARLVDRFVEALDLSDVTLVANDTGGAIAQCVAAYHPQRVGALVLTPCDAFDNFLPLPIRHLQLAGRTAAGLWLQAQALRFRVVQHLPIAFGGLTERPIPGEIMESYTGPLRQFGSTRRDFAALVRAISRRFTEDAAHDLGTFDKPTPHHLGAGAPAVLPRRPRPPARRPPGGRPRRADRRQRAIRHRGPAREGRRPRRLVRRRRHDRAKIGIPQGGADERRRAWLLRGRPRRGVARQPPAHGSRQCSAPSAPLAAMPTASASFPMHKDSSRITGV